MLHSPLPTAKDLFSQLIASEVKGDNEDIYQRYEIVEEESFEMIDEAMIEASYQESGSFEPDGFDVDEESEMKKRKRKTGAQLKVLKK